MAKMTSYLRNLAIAGIVILGVGTAQAQAPVHSIEPGSGIAETTPINLWPDVPEPVAASAPIVLTPPTPPVKRPERTIGTRSLALFAWPGYGMLGQTHDEEAQGQKAILVAERAAALLDGASTYVVLDTPCLPNAIRAAEGDPLLTLFGNRSKVGVLGSGSFLEVLANQGSVAIPRMVERKLGARAGHMARVATLVLDGGLTVVHVQLAIHNFTNATKLWQSVHAAEGN